MNKEKLKTTFSKRFTECCFIYDYVIKIKNFNFKFGQIVEKID
ncbi:hypothetical protein MPTP_1182 [Melissococcus plutonius ATCC 35311]|uniref:Uncharacterized protein n=2 Tax=Melissococcus plutonius TaxID=33970 RepID=F3YAV5_MELPT|nr:hypothetical protein MPTP_1182 [Melissococcus plutonius ATCC 35311]BAL62016.1 hypothetical protein MPD5_0773 [Melissococcus plutonius DAT561]BBC60889.1 hypothetical protein DAT561_0772 [Melissococcus plutonius]BBD15410.1 hypothetical protein DAT585_1082 [Melissococcus plutonius]BBD16921.1 hypothetical protein DAT606_0907 [Melissococcus plutonius]